MARESKASAPKPRSVAIVATPDSGLATLAGLYEVLGAGWVLDADTPPFRVAIVGERRGPIELASGVPIVVQRAIDEIDAIDIVIVPSLVIGAAAWEKGRWPRLVAWLRAMHGRGAVLCSACSGIFLLGETGVFDGQDATVHHAYARAFAATHPAISIHPERALVVSGRREELVSSGASTSWHDLALYLLARYAGPTAAQEIARFFALQWHQEGLAPYVVFEGRADHGDATILAAQRWLRTHFMVGSPVEEMVKRSRLPDRTFKRRFSRATGLTPIAYVQRLRVEEAKRRLERSRTPVDEIAWRVGYEEPAFFRRLFRRLTGLGPAAYRRRFRMPADDPPPR